MDSPIWSRVDFSEHLIDARDGVTLYCRHFGQSNDEPAVLCLPGLTRNCRDFQSLAQRLSVRWQVLTPDLRGRGQSDWDPNPRRYVLPNYVADTWRVLDRLEVERVVIIGTSLGGLVGMAMAVSAPRRVVGLVLNDVGPEVPAAAGRRIAGYVGRNGPVTNWNEVSEVVRSQYAACYPGEDESFWMSFARLSWREDESGRPIPDIDPAVISSLKKRYLRGRIVQWLRACLFLPGKAVPFDAWDAFERCTVPILLIRGQISDVTPIELVQRMLRIKPGMKVVDVPERGHAPTLDEPRAVRALERFLGELTH
jgi:pimeloyl-ACP methyl ester carboxylesterase